MMMMMMRWSLVALVHVLMLCVCASEGFDEGSGGNYSCPAWFYYSNLTNGCECEHFQDKISCDEVTKIVYIANGFCATKSDREEGLYHAGYCPFMHWENHHNRLYSQIPSDPTKLERFMCGPFKRKDLLCRKCIRGYGPAVYSHDLKCMKCHKSNIPLYLLIELLPLTLLYLAIVILNLNITWGPLLGYILFCQAFVLAIQENLDGYNYILSTSSPFQKFLFQASVAVSEVWSLQFLWGIAPPICFSDALTDLDLQMLSFVKMVYLVALLIATYILIRLYSVNCWLLRKIWKPFGTALDKSRIPVASDVTFHALGTFLLLSAPTVTYNMYTLFQRAPIYNNKDGSVKYTTILEAGNPHLKIPYAVLTSGAFLFLVLIPSILLCLYPTKIYTNYLLRFQGVKRREAIAAFVKSNNQCYKKRESGGWDLRASAGLVLLLCSFIRPVSDLAIRGSLGSHFLTGASLIFLSFVLSYARLCELTIANFSLSYHSMILGIFSIAGGLWRHDLNTGVNSLRLTFIVPPLFSHVVILLWVVYRIVQHVAATFFGYRFEVKPELVRLAGKVKRSLSKENFKRCFARVFRPRRRDGYEELVDATS